jgi:GcrA cell cycle regulator
MEWNEESIARLRAFWAEGLSTAEIGRRMGVSKNAIVGKAHRLNLAARPSPIRRDGAGGGAPRRPAARRVIGATLPSLSAPSVEHVMSAPPPMPRSSLSGSSLSGSSLAGVSSAGASSPRPASRPPVMTRQNAPVRSVAPRASRSAPCCWPIGEPGTPSFRFCDAEASSGKPYCTEHAQLAYVKVRDRREEAA